MLKVAGPQLFNFWGTISRPCRRVWEGGGVADGESGVAVGRLGVAVGDWLVASANSGVAGKVIIGSIVRVGDGVWAMSAMMDSIAAEVAAGGGRAEGRGVVTARRNSAGKRPRTWPGSA